MMFSFKFSQSPQLSVRLFHPPCLLPPGLALHTIFHSIISTAGFCFCKDTGTWDVLHQGWKRTNSPYQRCFGESAWTSKHGPQETSMAEWKIIEEALTLRRIKKQIVVQCCDNRKGWQRLLITRKSKMKKKLGFKLSQCQQLHLPVLH